MLRMSQEHNNEVYGKCVSVKWENICQQIQERDKAYVKVGMHFLRILTAHEIHTPRHASSARA